MSTSEESLSPEVVDGEEQTEQNSLLVNLNHKQQRFIHLYMTGQYSINKLAQLLEVHPNTLHNWLRRDDIKQIIMQMQETTHDMVSTQLKTLTMKATEKLSQLINSPIDGVALQAVKDILDRAGHKTKTEIKVDKTVRTFEEKIGELVDKTIVDVDYEVIEEE